MPEQTWAGFEKAQAALCVIAKDLGGACPSDLHAANLFLFRRAHDYRLEGSNWLRGKTYDGQAWSGPLLPFRDSLAGRSIEAVRESRPR